MPDDESEANRLLVELSQAAGRLAAAQAEVEELARQSVAAGATWAEVGDAARISRASVARLLRGDPHQLPPRKEWVAAMQAAVLVAYDHAGPGASVDMRAATLTDAAPLARRLRLAASNMATAPSAGSAAQHALSRGLAVTRAVLDPAKRAAP